MREEYERIKDEVHQSITHTNAISLGDLNGENDNNRLYENKFFDYAFIYNRELIAILLTRSVAKEYYEEVLNINDKKEIVLDY